MKRKERASGEDHVRAGRGHQPRLLSIPEVASELGLSEGRVYELLRLGILPAVRIGRQVRVDALRLEEWIAAGGKGLEEDELVIRELHQEYKDKDKVEITEVQETIF